MILMSKVFGNASFSARPAAVFGVRPSYQRSHLRPSRGPSSSSSEEEGWSESSRARRITLSRRALFAEMTGGPGEDRTPDPLVANQAWKRYLVGSLSFFFGLDIRFCSVFGRFCSQVVP